MGRAYSSGQITGPLSGSSPLLPHTTMSSPLLPHTTMSPSLLPQTTMSSSLVAHTVFSQSPPLHVSPQTTFIDCSKSHVIGSLPASVVAPHATPVAQAPAVAIRSPNCT